MDYTFSFQFLGKYGQFFVDGLVMTLQLSVFAVLLGTLFGTLMGDRKSTRLNSSH